MRNRFVLPLAFGTALLSSWMAHSSYAAPDAASLTDATPVVSAPAPVPAYDAARAADKPTAPPPASTAPPDPEKDGFAFLKAVYEAVMSKNWAWAGALALIGIVWALRKFGSGKLPWFKSDRGGAVLVMATSILGALATTLGAGQKMTGETVLHAVYLGFGAAGGYVWLRRMLGMKTS